MDAFAFKLEAFDPLDRCIPKSGDNQAISRDDLLTAIFDLSSIPTPVLEVPFNENLSLIMDQLFQDQMNKCDDIGHVFLQ